MNKVFIKPNQLDMRDGWWNNSSDGLAAIAEKLGLENKGDDYGHWFPAIRDHSPYEGGNVNDLVYHPKFQEYLAKEGKNGLRSWDVLDRGEIDISAMTRPEDIYNITTKRPTLQAYTKHKIPTSVLPKIKGSK